MKSSELQERVLEICTYILVILFIGLVIYYMEYGHHCNWKNCPHEGQIKFVPRWEHTGYKVTNIGRIAEEYHFYNPEWSEEKCMLSAENKFKHQK